MTREEASGTVAVGTMIAVTGLMCHSSDVSQGHFGLPCPAGGKFYRKGQPGDPPPPNNNNNNQVLREVGRGRDYIIKLMLI